jgi:nucleoside-diphosphate-sugar epimerase
VIHLHWRVDRTRSFDGQLAFEVERNLRGLGFLLDRVRTVGCRRWVNVSSVRVYGRRNRSPVTASSPPYPDTAYGVAKVAGERFLDARLDTGEIGEIGVSHLRIGAVASAGEHPSHLCARLRRSLLDGEPIEVNAGHLGYVTYIDEMVDLLIAALDAAPDTYLLAPHAHLNEDMAAAFARAAERELTATYRDFAPGSQDLLLVSDHAALAQSWCRTLDIDQMAHAYLAAVRARQSG